MTRILKDDRQLIASRASHKAVEKLKTEKEELGKKISNALYSLWMAENTTPLDRNVMDGIPEASKAAFVATETERQRWYIRTTYFKENGDEDFSYSSDVYTVGVPINIPAAYRESSLDVQIRKGDEIHKLICEYKKLESKIRQRAHEIQEQTLAVLKTASNVAKLLKVWPDVKGLLPDHLLNPPEKVYLPAFNPTKLNEAIGLPIEETEAA